MDVAHGHRDGRKQIPTYTGLVDLVDSDARVTTPYQEQLTRAGLVRIHEEYESFLGGTAGLRHELSRLRGQLDVAEEAVRRGLEEVAAASAELTEAELLPRNPQELALGDGPALRSRRVVMRERRIAAARQAQADRVTAVDARRRQITEVCGQLCHQLEVAQAMARWLGDYFVLRIATYWDAVAQKHPEGRHLASLMPTIVPTLPPWVDAACREGVITLPEPVAAPAGDRTAREAMPT